MRLNFQNHGRTAFATGLALAASAIAAVGAPGSASAAFPGTNGTLVTTKCEDGSACNIAHIWTVDPVSGAGHQLTSGAEYDDDPSFSPDGNRIAFERCPTGSTCRIAIMDASGANRTDLTDASGTGQDYPSFSPQRRPHRFREEGRHRTAHLRGER
jgi:Tol biopolymer transport system component